MKKITIAVQRTYLVVNDIPNDAFASSSYDTCEKDNKYNFFRIGYQTCLIGVDPQTNFFIQNTLFTTSNGS